MMRKVSIINSGSMADVAFTLLIFFLVSTTLAVDKGTKVLLPPYEPCNGVNCFLDINTDNLFKIQILQNDDIKVKEQDFDKDKLKEEAFLFLTNNGKNPNYSDSFQDAVINIVVHPDSNYETYVETISSIRAAYNDARNLVANEQFGLNYDQLSIEDAQVIRQLVPMNLFEGLMDNN